MKLLVLLVLLSLVSPNSWAAAARAPHEALVKKARDRKVARMATAKPAPRKASKKARRR